MSDIKQFPLRLPIALYESIEMQAIQLNMSVNKLIVAMLSDSSGKTPTNMKSIEATRRVAATLPNTFAAPDLPTPAGDRYAKPAHALNCHCYACQLPKGDK